MDWWDRVRRLADSAASALFKPTEQEIGEAVAAGIKAELEAQAAGRTLTEEEKDKIAMDAAAGAVAGRAKEAAAVVDTKAKEYGGYVLVGLALLVLIVLLKD